MKLTHAALTKRGEESGADLQSYREYKECKAQIAGKAEHITIDLHTKVAEGDTCKEYPGRAQRD